LNRYRYGRLKTCDPSRFLEDVDPAFIHVTKKFRSKGPLIPAPPFSTKSFVKNAKKDAFARKSATIRHTPSPDFQPSDPALLKEGSKIEHPKFGFGKVKLLDTNGSNSKAKVEFEKAGEKTLLLSFAKLRILD